MVFKLLELIRFLLGNLSIQLFTLIVRDVEVRCDRRQFSVLCPFIEKSMTIFILLICNESDERAITVQPAHTWKKVEEN